MCEHEIVAWTQHSVRKTLGLDPDSTPGGYCGHIICSTPYLALTALLSIFAIFQGKFKEAEPLYKHSLAVYERVCGPDHREVAAVLNNRAGLLERQVHSPETVLRCGCVLCDTEQRLLFSEIKVLGVCWQSCQDEILIASRSKRPSRESRGNFQVLSHGTLLDRHGMRLDVRTGSPLLPVRLF